MEAGDFAGAREVAGELQRTSPGDPRPSELLAEVANPLPAVVLFDRLHPAGYRRYRADPEAEEFAAETHLRLYRLR